MRYLTFNQGPVKAIRALDGSYNAVFDRNTGEFHRWGRTHEEDPQSGPVEILDLEISEGDCINCPFCYKENGPQAHEHHMDLSTFTTLLGKMPQTLTQIAFGITNLNSNPDFRAIAEYSRSQGVIPNYTFNGHQMTDEWAEWTAKTCGAVACSVYSKEHSYDAIKKLTDRGMKQVNIHFMLSEETYERAWEILRDRLSDPRLADLNAIVFLAYKPKGRNRGQGKFHTITDVNKYKTIIEYCTENGISFGCDSCSAPMILKAYENTEAYHRVAPMIEPCESLAFSSYINCHGILFPCSFTEGEEGWETGLDVLSCSDWYQDIWEHPRAVLFRGESCSSAKTLCSNSGCLSQSICRRCITFPSLGCA
jgi:hypothetical protein